MTTTVVWVKDFRQNISKFIKEARENNVSYIVLKRNKPVLEIKPCFNETIELDETQVRYYKTLENSLDFWNNPNDDNIFDY